MNVVSTASVLPCTPADVAGFLSVVFVGPHKFSSKSLGSTFRVRKAKVWAFLVWLKNHNRLYADIPIDPHVVELYPDDGVLPGLSDCVVEDLESNPKFLFEEETSGFDAYPATLVYDVEQDSELLAESEPVTLLEKMGVSDPESVRLLQLHFAT